MSTSYYFKTPRSRYFDIRNQYFKKISYYWYKVSTYFEKASFGTMNCDIMYVKCPFVTCKHSAFNPFTQAKQWAVRGQATSEVLVAVPQSSDGRGNSLTTGPQAAPHKRACKVNICNNTLPVMFYCFNQICIICIITKYDHKHLMTGDDNMHEIMELTLKMNFRYNPRNEGNPR